MGAQLDLSSQDNIAWGVGLFIGGATHDDVAV
jgi:hypothetical protein